MNVIRQKTENMDAKQISRLQPCQSPISISVRHCTRSTSLPPLDYTRYWDKSANGTLHNTGQTAMFMVTAEAAVRPHLSGGPLVEEYVFEQMHFHWSLDDCNGSEHLLDGQGYAAECHLVHYNMKYGCFDAALSHADGLAVVGLMLQVDDQPNPGFDSLVRGLTNIRKKGDSVQVTNECLSWVSRHALHRGSYVTYKGSLTTPPYAECVTWILYETPVLIGREQLEPLRQLEESNNEPIQRNVRETQRPTQGHNVVYVRTQPTAKL